MEAGRDGADDDQRHAEGRGLGCDDDARLGGRPHLRDRARHEGAHSARDVGPALEAALRTKGPKRTETQRFIGDRYDRFLFLVSQLQAAVRSGLVRKDDVQFPLSWYVEKRLCGHRKLLLAYIA